MIRNKTHHISCFKAKAKAENKAIFVDVFAVWCSPCSYMSKTVFTKNTVGHFFNSNFISVKIDAETEAGRMFASEYPIEAYPTVMFFDNNSQLLEKNKGLLNDVELLEKANLLLKNNPNLGGILSDFRKAKLPTEQMKLYLRTLIANGDSTNTEELFPIFWNKLTDKQKLEGDNFTLARHSVKSLDSPVFKDLFNKRSAYQQLFKYDSVDYLIGGLLEREFIKYWRAKTEEQSPSQAQLFEKINKYRKNSTDYYRAKYEYFEASFKEDETATRIARKNFNDNHEQDVYQLTNEAWAVASSYGKYDSFENGLAWVDKSLKIQYTPGAGTTKAWILYQLGQKKQAKELAQEAIQKAGDNQSLINFTKWMILEYK